MSFGLPKPPTSKLLLTSREAAEVLSMSERTLWGLADAGAIQRVRFGFGKRLSVRYHVDDLNRWIDSCKGGNSLDSVSQL